MKQIRMMFLMIAVGIIFIPLANALDVNVDARSDVSYTTYIKNEAYIAMSALQTLPVVNAYEKIRLKASEQLEQVKFNFDGRIYLYPDKGTVDYAVDTAFFSVENGPLVLYAGKQRIKWGTGYFWNPSDSLQPQKDIFRTTEDLQGILAIRAEASNDFITPSLIIIPKPQAGTAWVYDNFNMALQLYKLVGTADVFLNYIYSNTQTVLGAALSWDAGLVVLNVESAAKKNTALEGQNAFFKYSWTAGISKTITESIFAVVEYYRNNDGVSNEDYSLNTASGIYLPAMGKKNYLAYSASYTWSDTIGLGLTGMHGLDDGTSYLFSTLSWVQSTSYDLQLSLLSNLSGTGMKEGYYSMPVYNTVELRINAYF